MAKRVCSIDIGVDVGKHELVCCRHDDQGLESIANEPGAIRQWLRGLPAGAALAVEATSTFHLKLIELAHQSELAVYLINGYQLSNYRKGVGTRAKTDACDARLLARFLHNEKDELRRWTPPPKAYRRVQTLLQRRARLVQSKTGLKQSFEGLSELQNSARAVLRRMEHLEQLINKRLTQAAREAGWWPDVRRVQAIEGIGPINAIALVMSFNRGAFRSSDAFVAFLGLDVRPRDSGAQVGRRKLTKQGPAELRRLLYNAAMAARNHSARWNALYEYHLNKGLAKTQALVILARKLARVAFALVRNQRQYQPAGA